MNPLIKKEIRLLLPSWLAVLALEILLPWFWRDVDVSFGVLPIFIFLGMILLAVDPFGRECSLGTFQSLLAQPMERREIWRAKISVLFLAAVLILAGYFVSCDLRLHLALANTDSVWHANPKIIQTDFQNGMLGCVVAALVALAGGLWTTLLFRQPATAFWITFLVPAGVLLLIALVMSKFFNSASDAVVFSVLYGAAGIYTVAGFWLARRLFFRAQDVAWTGGIISFSKWRYYEAVADGSASVRRRRPLSALLKKEFQLNSIGLICVGALLALHIGVFFLRGFYGNFHHGSVSDMISEMFWVLWLVMPLMIGCMAVAEERKLGVTEAQFCLPVSRRVQFAGKFIPVMIFGVLAGGVMPLLLETLAGCFGEPSDFFQQVSRASNAFGIRGMVWFEGSIVLLSAGLAFVGFFASTLARNFLQALSIAIVIIIGCCLFIFWLPAGDSQFAVWRAESFGKILPLVFSILTALVVAPWLAYRNFNQVAEGGRLWRRNVFAVVGALLFIFTASALLHNRAWEIFEPAEPAHGPAKLSLANPPSIRVVQYDNLLVRLPDGRVWFDRLGDFPGNYWKYVWQKLNHPLPESIGPRQFLAGSNWVAATTEHMYFAWNWNDPDKAKQFVASDFMETVGIQPDGTLWISDKPATNQWTPGKLHQFGSEKNWKQIVQARTSVVLLKSDGTLWRWGATTNELHQWPGLRAFTPYQIGTNSDWRELLTFGGIFVRQTNGPVWRLEVDGKTGKDEFHRTANLDEVNLQTASNVGEQTAFVRADGTLWRLNRYWDEKSRRLKGVGVLQVGKENDWRAVAVNYNMMVALKADGSLWQWNFMQGDIVRAVNDSPVRLGIHNDWVAIVGNWSSVIALAGDGSLWLWPDRKAFDYGLLIRLPKQPEYLGNVLKSSD